MDRAELMEAIKEMSVMELAEFVEELEEEFGVSAAAPVAMAAAPGAAGDDAADEQTEFDVMLKAAGDQKIKVIKAVREITALGLKDAKELVDNAPSAIKEGVDKEEADELVSKLEEVGAEVELK